MNNRNQAGVPADGRAAQSLRNDSSMRKWTRKVLKHRQYYYLLVPGLLYFLIFKYIPMLGVSMAFQDFKITGGMFGSPWAGLKWFHILFDNDDFWIAFRNTLIISVYKLVFYFPAPIIAAMLINEVFSSKIKRTIQTIIYFPHFTSWVIISGVMVTILSPSTGLVSLFHMSSSPLMQPEYFRSLLVASEIWKEMGWGTVIYFAAISGINPEQYEAATIDGANRLRMAWNITLPSIANTIVIMFILRTGHILSVGFDQVYNLYNPLVYNVGDILDTYVYRTGLTSGRFSLATAAGLFQSAVGLVLLLICNWTAKRLGREGIW
ncbi:ABC transporter permease subunit [Paenibacillus sp. HB172176]|uniref:ABC transporter permease n=1 Tax=Paenibacillus sp. HB172176 TaxID=2493690 RepID=UPI001F101147|nr:ABC transporter permease subunit [Paenibacillus sp. HB172176]